MKANGLRKIVRLFAGDGNAEQSVDIEVEQTRACPHCRSEVSRGATVCLHCERELVPVMSSVDFVDRFGSFRKRSASEVRDEGHQSFSHSND